MKRKSQPAIMNWSSASGRFSGRVEAPLIRQMETSCVSVPGVSSASSSHRAPQTRRRGRTPQTNHARRSCTAVRVLPGISELARLAANGPTGRRVRNARQRGGYIAELKDRVGSVTIYGSIYKLRRAATRRSRGLWRTHRPWPHRYAPGHCREDEWLMPGPCGCWSNGQRPTNKACGLLRQMI